MLKLLTIIFLVLIAGSSGAQHAAFMSCGTITFERRVNTFAAMEILLKETKRMEEDQIPAFMSRYKSNSTQFWTDIFELYFDKTHTLYQPQNADIDYLKTFNLPIAYKNIVYSDFLNRKTVSVKQAFERSFFIKDSTRNVRWKLTEETREIAGFQCRRANALLFDSIYVVAYYSDEILTKGGPESFNGLPGMILGIAIPHLHITIFAQKVTGIDTSVERWKLPSQEKKVIVDNNDFKTTMVSLIRQFRFDSAWVRFFMSM